MFEQIKNKNQKIFVTGGIWTLNPLLQSQESYPLDQRALDTRRATNSKYKLLVQSLMINFSEKGAKGGLIFWHFHLCLGLSQKHFNSSLALHGF